MLYGLSNQEAPTAVLEILREAADKSLKVHRIMLKTTQLSVKISVTDFQPETVQINVISTVLQGP